MSPGQTPSTTMQYICLVSTSSRSHCSSSMRLGLYNLTEVSCQPCDMQNGITTGSAPGQKPQLPLREPARVPLLSQQWPPILLKTPLLSGSHDALLVHVSTSTAGT